MAHQLYFVLLFSFFENLLNFAPPKPKQIFHFPYPCYAFVDTKQLVTGTKRGLVGQTSLSPFMENHVQF